MTDNYLGRGKKILERIEKLAAYTETPGILTRTFGIEAFVSACLQVKLWMEDSGLEVRIDNIGNVRGRWKSTHNSAGTLVIGSHIDTVPNAGKFDGPLGILMGLDVLEHLKKITPDLPFHIELIAFCDEEGVRFHTTYLGSKVVAGIFDETLLHKKDASRISLEEALHHLKLSPDRISSDSISKEHLLGYFEMHIEQGPVLYERNIPVAIVSHIAGQRRAMITFSGTAGHAGTVPMDMRKDALCGAAEFILEVEKASWENKDKTVATVGKLQVKDSASNVIPGEVTLTLDLRSADLEVLEKIYARLRSTAEGICQTRRLQLSWELVQETSPLAMDAGLNNLLQDAIEQHGIPCLRLVSGAGHDAVAMAKAAPVCMLFIRCYQGISHHPEENTELKDIAAALQVTDTFLQNYIQKH